MIRLYAYTDNTVFKDFSNSVFLTEECEFDFVADKVIIAGSEFRLSNMINSNQLDKHLGYISSIAEVIINNISFENFIYEMYAETLIAGKYNRFSTDIFGNLTEFTCVSENPTYAVSSNGNIFYKSDIDGFVYMKSLENEITKIEIIITSEGLPELIVNSGGTVIWQ